MLRVAEHVRVASDEFVGDVAQRVRHGEAPFVGFDLCEEHALEEQVADLAAKVIVIGTVDRVEHFVGFLEHERAQRLERLLAIPWTSAWAAQRPHDVHELLERASCGIRGRGWLAALLFRLP